jgi:hypothetical protein
VGVGVGVGVGVRVEVGVDVGVGVEVRVGMRVGVSVGVLVRVGAGIEVEVGARVEVKAAVKVGLGVAVGGSVAVGDGVLACLRQPETTQAKASATAMTLQTEPEYDIESGGFTECGTVDSVNPLDSLSYPRGKPPHSHLTTLSSKTTIL